MRVSWTTPLVDDPPLFKFLDNILFRLPHAVLTVIFAGVVAVTEWSDRWPGVRKVPGILEPALTAAGVDHDIKVYPDAGHGFLKQPRPR
jgi:Dienelactone hydrolase family